MSAVEVPQNMSEALEMRPETVPAGRRDLVPSENHKENAPEGEDPQERFAAMGCPSPRTALL